jgi:GntR family transcriptional regulator, transcriptional repressor for pyruvate dehydrogenase complex
MSWDDAGTPVVPLRRRSVSDQAVDAIKDMILAGELRPGEPLPAERQLAEMLHISRPTLNVLESRQGEGTFVTSLSPTVLSEPLRFLLALDEAALGHLFQVRGVLEVSAAALAAPRIGDAELATLRDLVARSDAAIGDPDTFVLIDFQLHAAIVAVAGNPILDALCASIADLSLESRRRTAASAQVRRIAHRDHKRIVAALAARDADATANAMRAHLEAIEKAFHRLTGIGRDQPA